MWPLFENHHKEISHHKDIPLNPDVIHYDRLEKAGILRVFTARDGLKLAGYSVFVVQSHPHFKEVKQAKQEILFLSPEYRGKHNGIKFIRWCDDELKKEFVNVVYQHVNKDHDFSPILKKIGYELIDLIYGRRL